jgi:hypothetical protein
MLRFADWSRLFKTARYEDNSETWQSCSKLTCNPFGLVTSCSMHKNDPKQESNQATLARVKKEMDEPRMAESTREEDINQTTRQKLEKLP